MKRISIDPKSAIITGIVFILLIFALQAFGNVISDQYVVLDKRAVITISDDIIQIGILHPDKIHDIEMRMLMEEAIRLRHGEEAKLIFKDHSE